MLQKLKRRILVIDDDPGVGELLRRVFEDTGRYLVEAQSDPMVAVATARHYQPDLLIVDVRMPGLGGVELATELRAEPALQDRPIIFYTGVPLRDIPAAAIDGIERTEYLPKGTSAAGMVAAADRMLEAAGERITSTEK